MGAVGWLGIAVSVISLSLSMAAVVGAVRALARRGSRAPLLAVMGLGQYRRAGSVVVRGGPVPPGEVGTLRAVAGEMAGQGHLVVLGAAMAAVWVALALLAVSAPWPWALASVFAAVVAVAMAVVAVVMAAVAVWMARRVRAARRFLAVHPAPGVVGAGR